VLVCQEADNFRARGANFSFVFSEIMLHQLRPRPIRGAFRDRHERWAGDAVGVSGCSVIHADEQSDAHGEIVWSWHPGAGAKSVLLMTSARMTGAREPVPGEITYKP
jgi:hypothetical protein